jgi:sigma-B regulation protein RsbU (phosphoserine phosphatase)
MQDRENIISKISENAIRILFDLPFPFVLLDSNGVICFYNNSFSDILGYNTEITGKKISDFFSFEETNFYKILDSLSDSLFTSFKVVKNSGDDEKIYNVIFKKLTLDDKPYLQLFFQDISLEYTLYNQLQLKNRVMDDELSTGKKVLDHILYISPIYNSYIRFETFFKPSAQLGGDFYDIFQIDENRIGVLIADVSGHGVSSSLITATFKMLINLIPKDFSIEKMIYFLNSTLLKILLEDQFVTLFYGILDTREYSIEYINCGHPLPIIYDEKEKKFFNLKKTTHPLGIIHEFSYSKYITKEKIPKICKIFLFTDGIFSFNKRNEAISQDELISILNEYYYTTSYNLLNKVYLRLLKEYERFEEDDISMILIKVNKNFAYKNNFSIPSNILEVDNAVINIINTLKKVIKLNEEKEWRIYTSLYEAIINAIEHGNKNNIQKRVHITYRILKNWLIFKVRDEGHGFEVSSLPDPLDSKNILIPSGRGIYIIKRLMDKVKFNKTGNEISMCLKID